MKSIKNEYNFELSLKEDSAQIPTIFRGTSNRGGFIELRSKEVEANNKATSALLSKKGGRISIEPGDDEDTLLLNGQFIERDVLFYKAELQREK